MVYLYKI